MRTFRQALEDAAARKSAIGHFNISELATAKAIAEAARAAGAPVAIGLSEGEREFIGVHAAVALVHALRDEYDVELYLNADHTHSIEKAKQAIDAGFDEVLFDGGKFSWDENIAATREVVAYARQTDPNIIIEGELGYIGSSSEIRRELPKGAAVRAEDLTTANEAKKFIEATGVDMLAPAVGNIHGMFANAPEPALDITRIREVAQAAGVPLVLHGASGNTDSDIRAAVAAGVRLVHVSTELRLAWRKALVSSLAEHPDEVAPYKLLSQSVDAVRAVAAAKLKLLDFTR